MPTPDYSIALISLSVSIFVNFALILTLFSLSNDDYYTICEFDPELDLALWFNSLLLCFMLNEFTALLFDYIDLGP